MEKSWTKIQLLSKYSHLQWNFNWLEHPDLIFIRKRMATIPWRLVGGCVRDSLIGKTTYDIDINTPALPQEIINIFEDCNINQIGREHGTIMIFLKNYKIEITTLRKDDTTDGRHATVSFNSDWVTDSNRRDFTINALMFDPNLQVLYDYHNGLEDLSRYTVKFIGNPDKRIEEDYLRILRYIRFAIRFQDTESQCVTTLNMMKVHINGLVKVSTERIIQEFLLIAEDNNWLRGMQYIDYLAIPHLLKVQFNIKEPALFNIDLQNSVTNRIIYVLIKNHSNTINNLPLPSSMKKIFTKTNFLLSEVLNGQCKQRLFDIFSLDEINFQVFKIRQKYHGEQLDIMEKMNKLREDKQFLSVFNQKKEVVIKETPPSYLVRENICKVFEELFNEYSSYY